MCQSLQASPLAESIVRWLPRAPVQLAQRPLASESAHDTSVPVHFSSALAHPSTASENDTRVHTEIGKYVV